MSLSKLSDECAGLHGEFVFGPVHVEPDHESCSGGQTRPGLLGGWTCPCVCHCTPHTHSCRCDIRQSDARVEQDMQGTQ